MAPRKKQKRSKRIKDIKKLTALKGIGKKLANDLLKAYGTAAGVFRATEKQLIETLGDNRGTALWRQINEGVLPQVGRNPKYDTKTAKSIASDYADAEGTIAEIMQKHNLHEDSFFRWQKELPEFHELIKTAKKKRRAKSYQMALNGKAKLLEGYQAIDTTTIAVPKKDPKTGKTTNIHKQTTITKKHIKPSSTMIIFELINSSDGEYRDVRHIMYEGIDDPPPLNLENFSNEELKLWLELIEKAKNGTSDQ